MDNLPWARWWWHQCRAVKEPQDWEDYWGRCELKKKHDGDHALDRGFDIPTWSTVWTG